MGRSQIFILKMKDEGIEWPFGILDKMLKISYEGLLSTHQSFIHEYESLKKREKLTYAILMSVPRFVLCQS